MSTAREALHRISEMDPQGVRADDLGRAVRIAREALAAQPAAPAVLAEPSPTAGMTIEQRILHVGGRNNAAGYVEFGSTQAVLALVRQVLRDLPAQATPAQALQAASTLAGSDVEPMQADCGNAECAWRGPVSECSMLGSVGPLCPRCREIVEPDANKPAASVVRPEVTAEQYIQCVIDRAPDPLQRLGSYLASVLGGDVWNTVERMLIGACEAATPLTEEFIEANIGADEGDRAAVLALVREVEEAHRISSVAKPLPQTDQNIGYISIPTGLHPTTAQLVQRFATALAAKLRNAERKHGYTDGWQQSGWMDECRDQLLEHLAKGDPRDVAAYCAFLWHHGEHTSGLPTTPPGVPEPLLQALRFYARQEHYHIDDSAEPVNEFDTLSGEPANWLHSMNEGDVTMIEDGSVARMALRGQVLSWMDGDEDGTPIPIEGEAIERQGS